MQRNYWLNTRQPTRNLKNPQSKDERFTELSGSLDELDDTKNDSNYDPNKSTSASSDQLKQKEIPLPTIRRPKCDL